MADASKGETPATFFCPAGSAMPTRVSTGHYTACDNKGSLLCSERLRTDQIPCESGLLCVGGYQRRAIEWPPGLCTCTFSTHPTTGATIDTCLPAAPLTVDDKVKGLYHIVIMVLYDMLWLGFISSIFYIVFFD